MKVIRGMGVGEIHNERNTIIEHNTCTCGIKNRSHTCQSRARVDAGPFHSSAPFPQVTWVLKGVAQIVYIHGARTVAGDGILQSAFLSRPPGVQLSCKTIRMVARRRVLWLGWKGVFVAMDGQVVANPSGNSCPTELAGFCPNTCLWVSGRNVAA